MCTRRVPHEHNASVIASEGLDVALNPSDGAGSVLDERRKGGGGIEAIVRQYCDESVLRERGTDKTVMALVAFGPGSSIPEDDYGQSFRLPWGIYIQVLAGLVTVGDIGSQA